ncbi:MULTISPECIES: TetR/AcrR family transcriptional regulator [Paenibacillus]|uniref:TetR/AcrR family transcriptional regulator n=1 Tax=Paenibacillus violae TaxID=3077234 RepID=A0ABU3R7L1_9BACL|nr:TetR/AcrR family transcriptional regulator [Paenibacillus sp. PFR10]MDU0200267.1 TetR/AcrR family transcriptional regulator [Paenibacillus sp. PFR10]
MNAPVKQDAKTKLLKKLIVSVSRDGFQHLRMDDIAKNMDVSRATMYRHFPSKEDVMDGVVRMIVDYIERLEESKENEDESYFCVWFQQLFEQSVSLVEYITDVLMKDLQIAYPDLYNMLKGVLQKREENSLRFYRQGKDKGIFNTINEKFILLQDDLLLHEITSVRYLLNNQTTIKEVLNDYYQFKKIQLFKADKISLVDDANINSVIDRLSEKFNRTLM